MTIAERHVGAELGATAPAPDVLEAVCRVLARHDGATLGQSTAMDILNEVAQVLGDSHALREKVWALQRSMLGLPQPECPVVHRFAPGLYAREISIAKGVTVVGAVHRTDNLVVLSKGRILAVTASGAEVFTAPHTFMCNAGQKNAVHALEDAVWTNFFPTTETDLDRLVEQLTFSKASELLGGDENAQRIAFEKLTLGSR